MKNEYVVVSAHIDHLGVGNPIDGDSIYHGAMDNASGVFAVLEVAASMARAKEKPRRSVIFLLPTGEEQGTLLLGSKYFASHPTVPLTALVANLNIDVILALHPLKSLVVNGVDESDLGKDVSVVGTKLGLEILPGLQGEHAGGGNAHKMAGGALPRAIRRSPAAHRPASC